MQKYDAEQKALAEEVERSRNVPEDTEQQALDLRETLCALRVMTDVKELTPTMVNTLIQRIVVRSNEKKRSHNNVKVDISFTAIGLIDVPTEEETLKMMDEIQKHPLNFRVVA